MVRAADPRHRAALVLLGLAGLLSACELDEVTVATPEDVPVVEAYLMVGDGPDKVFAFLHWTVGTRPTRDLLDLQVTLTREDGLEVPLLPEEPSECLSFGVVDQVEGACYAPEFDVEGWFRPGSLVRMEVLLASHGPLRGETLVPEDFEIRNPGGVEQCALPPGKLLELSWSRSPGVWAYSAETEIAQLREALAAEGIEVEADSVALLGLAITDSDTTIVFPKEFGVFDRFDLEQEVALALQAGLPKGAVAEVTIAALDRNYVNWIRRGNFNPSGPVRVSSIRGSGVGVFGSVVRRGVRVRGADPGFFPGGSIPSCLPAGGS